MLVLRDYFQDVEAAVAARNESFHLASLTIWSDIVEPPVMPTILHGDESADVLAAQEKASESKFQEVKVKLAADCQAMANYNLEKSKAASKGHVLKVLHEKKQNEIGKKFLGCSTRSPMQSIDVFHVTTATLSSCDARVVDDYMASSCYMGLIGDATMPSEVDTIIRATSVKQKAGRSACEFNLAVFN